VDDLAQRCRHLADLHAGLDIPERVTTAWAIQQEQRAALLQAAEEIELLRAELQAPRQSAVGSAMRAITSVISGRRT
jgi:hypothetical protein